MSKYNVLFIAVDDLCSVDDQLSLLIPGFDLPNLRRLKDSGTNFRRGYCTVPVCGPARAAMMTGLSPAETGVLSNNSEWYEAGIRPEHTQNYRFRQAGFWCGTAGKIFHGYGPQQQYIHDALYDDKRFYVSSWMPVERFKYGGAEGHAYAGDEARFYDYQMASFAIKHLQTYSGSRPWYFELGFFKPHTPYDAPVWCYEAVDWQDVTMPEAWKDGWTVPPFMDDWMLRALNSLSAQPDEWSAEQMEYWQKSVRNYAASALWFDHNLGRVLDALDASPFAQNTIVSLYSDHGYHLGEQGHWHKFTLYEAAGRAPMVIRVPGQKPKSIETPVLHHDIFATLHDYCDITPKAGSRGRSLRALIEEGQDTALAQRAVPTFWYGSCAIAWQQYRAILAGDGGFQLFDVEADVWLQNDISQTDPQAEAVKDLLLEAMQDWGWSVVIDGTLRSHGGSIASYLEQSTDLDSDIALMAPTTVIFGSGVPLGRAPYASDLWLRTWRGQALKLPSHIRDVAIMSKSQKLAVHANAQDGTLFIHPWDTADLDIFLGSGDRVFNGTRGRAKIRTGGGSNRVHLIAQGKRSELWLGTGNDTITAVAGAQIIHATGGTNQIRLAGDGADVVHSGHGRNVISTGGGDDTIHITGGQNVVDPGTGSNRIVLRRTGQPQVLKNLGAGKNIIDLSDFRGLKPIWRLQDEAHVLSCSDEEIRFEEADLAQIKAMIKGWPRACE